METIKCKYCEADISSSAKKCKYCGERLRENNNLERLNFWGFIKFVFNFRWRMNAKTYWRVLLWIVWYLFIAVIIIAVMEWSDDNILWILNVIGWITRTLVLILYFSASARRRHDIWSNGISAVLNIFPITALIIWNLKSEKEDNKWWKYIDPNH